MSDLKLDDFDIEELQKELAELEALDEMQDDYEKIMDYGASGEAEPEDGSEVGLKLGGSNDKPKEEESSLYRAITEEDINNNAYVLYPKKRTYRSILLEVFTPERCIELERLQRSFSITNNKKIDIIKQWLTEWGVDYHPIGPGTNRYAFSYDGWIIKVACDADGKIDNKREFKYSIDLQPYVIKCYEVFADGLMAVFEYVDAFTIDDFWKNIDKMKEILSEIAESYLIGDVGISTDNYGNWGFRDEDLVILDYAYIYSTSFRSFRCNCSPSALLYYDKDFNNLICPLCGKSYSFGTIRKRISRAEQDAEIGDINSQGYIITKMEEEKNFIPKFVYGATERIHKYLRKKQRKEGMICRKKRERQIAGEEPSLSLEELGKAIREGKFDNKEE